MLRVVFRRSLVLQLSSWHPFMLFLSCSANVDYSVTTCYNIFQYISIHSTMGPHLWLAGPVPSSSTFGRIAARVLGEQGSQKKMAHWDLILRTCVGHLHFMSYWGFLDFSWHSFSFAISCECTARTLCWVKCEVFPDKTPQGKCVTTNCHVAVDLGSKSPIHF